MSVPSWLRGAAVVVSGVLLLVLLAPVVYSATAANARAASPVSGSSPHVLQATTLAAPAIAPDGPVRMLASSGTVSLSAVRDSTASSGAHPSVSVVVGTQFPGIAGANSSCGCAPPDVQVAVGPSHVVEMVNTEGKIWTKAGKVVKSFTLAKFFITGTDFISDPKVIYDNQSGRWFATLLDVTSGTIHLAVSHNGSAAGTWTVYYVAGTPAGFFPDQPILGVSKNLIALGGNVFNTSTSAYLYGEVWAINKTDMLAGLSTYVNVFHSASWFSMHPVHSISSTATQFIVMTSGSSKLLLFKLTGVPSNTTSSSLSGGTSFTIHSFSTPPSAPQKGTAFLVDTSDNRVMDAVWRANVLWTTFDTGCKPAGDLTTRSCVRLVELKTGSSPSVVQDFNISKAKTYTFYGALTLDGSLNLVVVYGYSNSTVHPTVAVTGQLSSGSLGSLLTTKVLIAGAGSATVACSGSVCRWGDYYGAGADPNSPNIWVAGEYVPASTYWATWIASVRV
ncbi:MAG: hypothetical protein L3K11_07410 [Thermoplasmata archaeon]|nr:hypothetical protein [Thermoplasmata archaeon]